MSLNMTGGKTICPAFVQYILNLVTWFPASEGQTISPAPPSDPKGMDGGEAEPTCGQ